MVAVFGAVDVLKPAILAITAIAFLKEFTHNHF